MRKFVRDVGEFLPLIQKDGIDNVAPYMLMKMTMQMSDLDLGTRTRIVKELMEQFPHAKQTLKDWVNSVGELF